MVVQIINDCMQKVTQAELVLDPFYKRLASDLNELHDLLNGDIKYNKDIEKIREDFSL